MADFDEYIRLRFPKGIRLTEEQYFEFCQINDLKLVETEIDKEGFFNLIIKMGNFLETSEFTGEVYLRLALWNKEKHLGKVYPETAMYEVSADSWKEADASFIAFTKASKEKLKSLANKKSDVSATLLIEIDRTTINANFDLEKTKTFWIPFGTDYAIVIDLEARKWYFFNHSTVYSTHSFSEKFVAPSDLPDLILDFNEIAEACGF